jgi:hypothetical protein
MATPLVPGCDYIYIDDDGKIKFQNDISPPAGAGISDASVDLADVVAKFNVLLARLRVIGLI